MVDGTLIKTFYRNSTLPNKRKPASVVLGRGRLPLTHVDKEALACAAKTFPEI
jgi:hypothetical protein